MLLKQIIIKQENISLKRYFNFNFQGDIGEKFFIVEEGYALVTKNDSKNEPYIVKSYKRGDYFGELALINGTMRNATVIAKVI